MSQPRVVFDLIGLQTGSLALTGVHVARWGSEVTLDCVYQYPPEVKPFRLVFQHCSAVHWTVAREVGADDATAQMLTHDLGEANHQRTARFATVLGEIIISYGQLVVEKDWS